jgi:hypothetical protein
MVEISRTAAIKGSVAIGGVILPVDELHLHTPASKIATQENKEHPAPPRVAPPPAVVDLPASCQQTAYLFFNADNVVFHEAAVARLMHKDDEWALKRALEFGGSIGALASPTR